LTGSSTTGLQSLHQHSLLNLYFHIFQLPKMAGPDYGALGATFKVTRALQAVSMIAIIGMTANFISEMVSSNATPPNVLIGTLSVVSYKKPALSL
jgi:hypothetical protein